MYEDYFIVDIETSPLDVQAYTELEEEDRLKLLNPIDSKIIGIGIRYKWQNRIFTGDDEKDLLKSFWHEWERIMREAPNSVIVGFNINNFSIPFIITKSFINNVQVKSFSMKSIIDVRERINAYRYGKTKGKLTDYGELLGINVIKKESDKMADLYLRKDYEQLHTYIENDLVAIDEIFKRLKETGIINISKW